MLPLLYLAFAQEEYFLLRVNYQLIACKYKII